jgi:WD40 repeat protein
VAVDIAKNQVLVGFRRPAIDIFGDVCVRERDDGELAMNTLADGREIVSVSVPESRLGSLTTAEVSADGRWLALSGRTRGGVWDLTKQSGQRTLQLLGFAGGWLSDNVFHVIATEKDRSKRALVRFDLTTTKAPAPVPLATDHEISQTGRLLISFVPEAKEALPRRVTMEVKEVDSNRVLWTRRFDCLPVARQLEGSTGLMVLAWQLGNDQARKALMSDPEWSSKLKDAGDRDRILCFEVVDATSGRIRARVAIDTGPRWFLSARFFATDDRLFVLDQRGRVLAYGFDGKLLGRTLGRRATVSPDGKYLVVEVGDGRLSILDAATLKVLAPEDFQAGVSGVSFEGASGRLVVIGADQTVFTLDLAGIAATAPR